jgi:hypothetical protein
MISLNLVPKPILQLIVFYFLILLAGFVFASFINEEFSFIDILIEATVFSAISFITLIIFFKGQNKQPDSQTLHVLVAISLKFLLEMVFALVWLIVVKKSSLPSVLMFFVLYLTLTLFTVLVIIKTLKNKAL